MASVRLQRSARSISVAVSDRFSPKVRARAIARIARAGLKDSQDQNRKVLGTVPEHDTIVDGRKGAPLESVNPDHGAIVFRFKLLTEVVEWCWEQVLLHSPVLTGAYRGAHLLFADGVEMDAPDPRKTAREWVLLAPLPYSRKIERGQSDQAPDGVYEAVAALAHARFGNIAYVRFTYRSPVSAYVPGGANRAERAALRNDADRRAAMAAERDTRSPAIVIALR